MRSTWTVFIALLFFQCLSSKLFAIIASTAILCQKYSKSLGCEKQAASCAIRHTTALALNLYGEDIQAVLSGHIDVALLEIIGKVDGLDSDQDGIRNVDEILGNGVPGDAKVRPAVGVAVSYDSVLASR